MTPRRKECAEENKGNDGLPLRVLVPPRCKRARPLRPLTIPLLNQYDYGVRSRKNWARLVPKGSVREVAELLVESKVCQE